MTVVSIYKDHVINRGPRKGAVERFIVSPRVGDGAFCLKQPTDRSNREEAYSKVFTLAEVEQLTRVGWSVRMKSEATGAWNTLKSDGLIYAQG